MEQVNGHEERLELLTQQDSTPHDGTVVRIQIMRHIPCGGLVMTMWKLPEKGRAKFGATGVPCTNCEETWTFEVKGDGF